MMLSMVDKFEFIVLYMNKNWEQTYVINTLTMYLLLCIIRCC